MQLPEHVTLCDRCGCAPVHDMTIPKWVFLEMGDCWCNDHEHDDDCKYIGNDMWDCGAMDLQQG